MKKTYEIRTSKTIYNFYQVKANTLKEAEQLALSRNNKVNTLTTISTPDYCKELKK